MEILSKLYWNMNYYIIIAMTSNSQFLKKIDNNLYDIITDAERLYKDEYFEQCMTQTRRFGEQICKNMMEQNNREIGSFDDMLATLKDQSQGSVQEKEFIDDLYFLKKSGNQAVHSGKVKHEAMTALECLKRSFEAALTYCVYNQGAPTNILKLNYDVELLITDKKSKKSLKEKYEEAKAVQKAEKNTTKVICNSQKQQNIQEQKSYKYQYKQPISLFWKMVIFFTILSIAVILFLVIGVVITNLYQPH